MAKSNAERQADFRARQKSKGLRRNYENPRTPTAMALEKLNRSILEKSKDYWADETQAFFNFLFEQVKQYRP
jgi:hypothetical protein